MLAIFLILTYTVSITLHITMDATVHNQYSDIELTSPVCFCDGRTYTGYSVERMDNGTVIKVGTRFDLNQDKSEGILMCEVQRDRSTESDHQASTDTTFTEAAEDTSKITRLLVTWEIRSSGKFMVYIVLVEHDNELVLNEAELVQLYNNVNDIPYEVYEWILKYDGIYKSTWSIYDNIVLEATDELICEKGLELKITVTEGSKDEDTESALWIDSERQVSSLMI
jgi:hypothetical protein